MSLPTLSKVRKLIGKRDKDNVFSVCKAVMEESVCEP